MVGWFWTTVAQRLFSDRWFSEFLKMDVMLVSVNGQKHKRPLPQGYVKEFR